MAYRRASDEIFYRATIRKIAELGMENTRTKDVADGAGFSEAAMYRRFPTKEILLSETFLYVDKQISRILMQSPYIQDAGDTPFELTAHALWHDVFRYLLNHKEEALFLIRYRYSSFYTEETRSRRQAYNGGFEQVYAFLENHYGSSDGVYREFLVNYVFEMTLCFSEKIITGRLKDTKSTEERIWSVISSAMNTWTQCQGDV